MGAPSFPYPHRHPGPLGALRVDLDPGLSGTSGWWQPYSRDLHREVPHLVDQFPIGQGRVDRLVYAPCDWEPLHVGTTELFTRFGRIPVGFLPAARGGGLVLVRLAGAGVVTLRLTW